MHSSCRTPTSVQILTHFNHLYVSKIVFRRINQNNALFDTTVAQVHHFISNLIFSSPRHSGTGLHVDISIQNLEAAQQFVPLDLSDLNVSASSPAVLRSHSVQRFCSQPVPDHYILHYTKHLVRRWRSKHSLLNITHCSVNLNSETSTRPIHPSSHQTSGEILVIKTLTAKYTPLYSQSQ